MIEFIDNSRLKVFAPAKINLYLHITERLPNNYHALDSLVCFADIGDEITIEEADHFTFEVNGPFANIFSTQELDTSPTSKNLAVRAAWELSRKTHHSLDIKLTLTKNLPAGAGIGGGSADAAAVIHALLMYWKLPQTLDFLPELLKNLGADVPVCFARRPMRILGIGDIMEEMGELPELPILLIHPGKSCPTQDIFKYFNGHLTPHKTLLSTPFDEETLFDILVHTENYLTTPALKVVPDIENVLRELSIQNGCKISRMSGSGSSCFGIFNNEKAAQKAQKEIQSKNKDWWVKTATLNRIP